MLTTLELTIGRWVRMDGETLEVVGTCRTDDGEIGVILTDRDGMFTKVIEVPDVNAAIWEAA